MDERRFGMVTTRYQQTIASSCAVEGFGYWSGRDVRLEFHPAEVNTGVAFVRADLSGRPYIPAGVAYRRDMPRRTNLQVGAVSVDMVEHVLAALAGLQIDNCEIWTTAPEMPGCDGSAAAFVEALSAVGAIAQDAPRAQLVVQNTIRLGDRDSWIEAQPCGGGKTLLRYELDYASAPAIGRQELELPLNPLTFRSQIAPCRTFALRAEAEAWLSHGVGTRATARDLLVFDEHGPIDNPLRFPDECVRHKLLDMVGDLALAGCDLVGRFIAHRSGHHLNAELVRTLLDCSQLQDLRHCA